MTRWQSAMQRQRHAVGLSVAVGALALGLTSTACTAVLERDPVGGTLSGGGSSSLGNPNGGSAQGGLAAQVTPGFKSIHRLNNSEYNATVADVLKTKLQPANGAWRVYELNGFDNVADVQLVDTDQYQRYFDAAGSLADDVFANADFRSAFLTCSTTDDACVGGLIGNLGLHLFRRPLAATEVANYKT